MKPLLKIGITAMLPFALLALGGCSAESNHEAELSINDRSGEHNGSVVLLNPDRITKKPFGIHITPDNSPVQPERFSGYHTGADFEVLPSEDEETINFSAICDGKAMYKDFVDGYGGVFVQQCNISETPVTVLYGHVSIASISHNVGDDVMRGVPIGRLGKAFSKETDGERAHLHLGIYRGDGIDLRGYVAEEALLSQWIDPVLFLDISSPSLS